VGCDQIEEAKKGALAYPISRLTGLQNSDGVSDTVKRNGDLFARHDTRNLDRMALGYRGIRVPQSLVDLR
jgi:hypothetical protein